jgi:hypothetical protein
VLSQVVGEIRKKERASWTDDPDSLRYVETLERAQKTIFARLPTNARVADRRQKLWIDFVVAPQAAFVAIGAFEMEERGEEVRVVRREVLALPELSRRYVERNQRLIVADSFHVEGAALAKLLGPAPGE